MLIMKTASKRRRFNSVTLRNALILSHRLIRLITTRRHLTNRNLRRVLINVINYEFVSRMLTRSEERNMMRKNDLRGTTPTRRSRRNLHRRIQHCPYRRRYRRPFLRMVSRSLLNVAMTQAMDRYRSINGFESMVLLTIPFERVQGVIMRQVPELTRITISRKIRLL